MNHTDKQFVKCITEWRASTDKEVEMLRHIICLEEQIASMKCCGNCTNLVQSHCIHINMCGDFEKWRLRE